MVSQFRERGKNTYENCNLLPIFGRIVRIYNFAAILAATIRKIYQHWLFYQTICSEHSRLKQESLAFCSNAWSPSLLKNLANFAMFKNIFSFSVIFDKKLYKIGIYHQIYHRIGKSNVMFLTMFYKWLIEKDWWLFMNASHHEIFF